VLFAFLALLVVDLAVLTVVLVRVRRRQVAPPGDGEVFFAPRPAGLRGRERQLLSVEILDPTEVAARRRRAFGLLGTLAPGLVRRVVYDQTRKILLRELAAHGVRADVRMHTLRPASAEQAPADIIEAVPVDAPPPLDL
jgi:hypothetical protein